MEKTFRDPSMNETTATTLDTLDPEAVEARVAFLDENHPGSLEEIFAIVCAEFGIADGVMAQELGCRCPWGLMGYIEAWHQPLD